MHHRVAQAPKAATGRWCPTASWLNWLLALTEALKIASYFSANHWVLPDRSTDTFQLEGWNQLSWVVADDNFAVIDDGDRQRLDAPAAKVLHRGGFTEQVVVLVFDPVGLEELFQSPAAESTRLGIDLNVHGHTTFLPMQVLRVSYHGE